MDNLGNLLQIKNGEKISRADIPQVSFADFSKTLTDIADNDGYIVQFFAYKEGEANNLLAVVRQDAKLYVIGCEVDKTFPSLTASNEKFHMFEREIAEQYGIKPENHPWLKLVRYHANYQGYPDAFENNYKEDIPGNYPYFKVEGEDIHEVAVGPVHAGIIEPGHFRFQCIGEIVLHLEIQLGYQHRGVEKMLPTVGKKRLPIICESIAGDTAIGHNLCHCQAIESLGDLQVDDGAHIIRTIALELERIANHVGDLGALSGDVAFNPPAAYFGRLRGEFLNLLQVLSGNFDEAINQELLKVSTIIRRPSNVVDDFLEGDLESVFTLGDIFPDVDGTVLVVAHCFSLGGHDVLVARHTRLVLALGHSQVFQPAPDLVDGSECGS